MIQHETQIRVRYAETDQMGVVYYGQYATYCEVGRVELMRSLGIRYRDLEEVYGVIMPVIHMEVSYLRPARYDDLLTVRTSLKELSNFSIIFLTEIYNEKAKLLNSSRIKLCFLDQDTLRRVDTPDFFMELIEKS